MALDGITTAALVRQLQDELQGSRISKIIQPENDALLLTCKGSSGQKRVYLSASAALPLAYMTERNRQAPATAPNFCMLLRKHIGNGRILSVTQPGLERIIRFEIEHYDEMGDLQRKILILELMGKHSNLIFCRPLNEDEKEKFSSLRSDDGQPAVDCSEIIIDSIKHISAQTSSVREVLPGRPYFIPQTMQKSDPLTIGEENFCSLISGKAMPLSSAVYTSLTGISPVIAEELCHRASLDPARSALALTEPELTHLCHTFARMMEDVRGGEFTPRIIFNPQDEPVEFSPVALTVYADYEQKEFENISQVLEQYYALKDTVTRIRQKSSDLRRIVTTAHERTRKKLALQEKQLKDTNKREKYRLYGELLHTYGYSAAPGAKSLEVINYYTNEPVTIPLDDTLSAAENAKRYYDRYGKQKRTYEALTRQVAETREDLAHLESIQTFLEMALNEEDLVQVREELTEAGYIRRHYGGGKKVRITSRPYHYMTPDGYDLYVGKNNIQNDELTFKFASGGDWWFHSKGVPGSHVILKSKGGEIPDSAFEDAARLAAYYSKNRAAEKVEIDYVQKKEVKKPNGAKPGFVVYYTNYSMVIEPDISRLTLV